MEQNNVSKYLLLVLLCSILVFCLTAGDAGAVIVINGMNGQGAEMGWNDIPSNPWTPAEAVVIVGHEDDWTITATSDQVINGIVTIGETDGQERPGHFIVQGNGDDSDPDITFGNTEICNGLVEIVSGAAEFAYLEIDYPENTALEVDDDCYLVITDDDDGATDFYIEYGSVSIDGSLVMGEGSNDILQISNYDINVGTSELEIDSNGLITVGHVIQWGPIEIYGELNCTMDYTNGSQANGAGGNILGDCLRSCTSKIVKTGTNA